MSQKAKPQWVTFWDRANRRATVLSTIPRGWAFVEHDDEESKPGVYDVWRERGCGFNAPPSLQDCDVVCVEVHLSERDDVIDFPDHLLDRSVLGDMTLWVKPQDVLPSFMEWSRPQRRVAEDGDVLASKVQEFSEELEWFYGFGDVAFRVGELLDDTNWKWGYGRGVYCFISPDGTIQYVGRAMGATLGARIWNQLQSQQDPAWKEVVTNRETSVRVFTVEEGKGYMASALEAYLIERIKPPFNLRKQ